MAIYENGVWIDNQIEDGDPPAMESARYLQVIKVVRASSALVDRVFRAPKGLHDRALHIIDQLGRATGRM